MFTEGESVSGVSIDVSYNYGDPSTVTSGFTITPSGSLKTSDTKFYVTYEGITREQPITVNPKSSGGGGSSGGGSGETTGDYKAVIVYQPDKKDYKVGDKFDWTGTMIRIYKPDTNNNSVLYATLYGADLARYTDLEYTFKTADILGSGKTSIKCNFRVDGHKVEEFSITGLTVTAAKKTLDLSVKNHLISNIFVNMKRTAYPVGSTIALSDIEYIGGKDDNNSTVMLSPSDLSDYANTFSLEVLSVDRNGNTTRKSAAYKNKIESSDVYTNRYDDKVVYLRFYVDDDYLDFTVESGDSGVYVYYGSTLLGIYSELAQALEDVNDLDFKWGSSETKYSDTRKLTIKLGEDMKLGRYDGQIALNRDIDIDLNGHKLTVYSDVFVFLDKKIDVFKATIGNTATETGTLIYDNMPYDDLLIDKGESIVFQYTDDKNADLPGIYTLTVEEPKNGAVASNPGLSRENKVTVSHGHDATFTVTPDANYEIESVKVKSGNSSTATTVSSTTNTGYSVNSSGVATYTMKDVKGVATVTATFKAAKAEKPADTWENPFKDISSYASYFDAVKYVSQNGLMQGDDLGNFNPSQTMTRAQFVTTLGRMYLGTIYSTVAEKDAAMIRTYGTDSQFTDVSYSDGRISYAVPYIKWAESNGLVQGYGNGKFGPYDTITHQQMYIIMYRYAQSLAMKSINVSSVMLRASDADELGAGWLAAAKEGAIAAAKYAQQQNFLVSTTRIDPNGNALRYELATLLMQFSKNVLGRE
ncbi:MAG: S-layer homology domain-containing protein [Clostridiales bacterium]|nr:S-layer homology domain-containing protein [Clostridiales bacterium]